MIRLITVAGLIVMFMTNNATAKEESSNVCLYAGQPYTEGSVILMEGVKKVCRDESYSCIKEEKENPHLYISPSLCNTLAWRDILQK
jgi:hypothetical protein